MSQATRPNDRHIIWSNQNLDVDDWREDYKEFLEANELDDDPNDEQLRTYTKTHHQPSA